MHWYVKNAPVINNIIFEISAQKFLNGDPLIKDLKKSNPPRNAIKPKRTTICINNFFLLENLIDKFEKIKIGKPIKDGMNEVKELLPLTKLTTSPQKIKKDP